MENTIQILRQTSYGLEFDTKLLFNTLDKIGDKNIAIVSINGKQNSGKSLLLNQFMRSLNIIESNKHCYYSGDGDHMSTNGILMWSEPIVVTADDGSEMVLILMDTSCDFEEKISYQQNGVIFAISSLLSSTIIANIQNDLSEDMLQFVDYFSHFAQSLNNESKPELFQQLIFLMRDRDNEFPYRYGYHDDCTPRDNNFMNDMVNRNIDHSIEEQNTRVNLNISIELKEQNTRKNLLSCFDDICCYLMPNPGMYATKSSISGQIDLIDPVFVEKSEEFIQLIIGKLEPKIIGGHKLTSNSLKYYMKKWQHMIENDAKPKPKFVCPLSDEKSLELTFKRAFNFYEKRIMACIETNPSDEELYSSHINAEQESWNYISAELNERDNDETVNKLLDLLSQSINDLFKRFRMENMDRIEDEDRVACGVCFARSVCPNEEVSPNPDKIISLELQCPGGCEPQENYWHCFLCKQLLHYDFDGYFYCLCGKSGVNNFEFKCNSKKHSLNYIRFSENRLKHLLSNKEINILILGETGVGKSTWINGFVNYLTFPSLNEAKKYELVSLIASSFTITDSNYEEREITCGEEENEVFIAGQSATQEPKTYVFGFENMLIRIIDTPGIGDTRGINQDKQNLDMILRYLSNLDKLHGICILLKPNNARLTVMFRFCIKQLLTHLHRDASRNIVFCFTNARSTFYRPGDTMKSLKNLLKENEEVEIKLSKDTIYCMDNESFRFLCAFHHGIEFDEEEYNNFAKSWDKSVNETKRMIEYICGLTPHAVSDTLSLNDTRKIIVSLSKPMADITQNILNNISVIEDRKREIFCTEETEKGLKEKLYMDVIELEAKQLEYAINVCTSETCVRYHNIPGSTLSTIEYVTHCHIKCRVRGVKPEAYPNPNLKYCRAMAKTDNCTNCGCRWEKHMHYTYEQKPVKKRVFDQSVQDLIKNKQTVRQGIELQVNNMEQYVMALNEEKDMITKISAKFGAFLKANSIVPYNDALGEYLDVLIRMEKDKVSAGGDRKVLDGMEQMKKDYNEEVRLLDLYMTDGKDEHLTPTDMNELVNKLYSLKHKGKELKHIMEVASAANMQIIKYHETNCRTKCTKPNLKIQTHQQTTSSILVPVWRKINTIKNFFF